MGRARPQVMAVRHQVRCWSAVELVDLPTVAREIVEVLPYQGVVAVEGPMGAGKTTVIRAICKVIGVVDDVLSPTFGLVNEYETLSGRQINHLDLYRIRDEVEAEAMGLSAYFDGPALNLVEWAGRAAELLPSKTWLLEISEEDPKEKGDRKIELCTFEPHGNEPESD